MTLEEYKKSINHRTNEKCCRNCKFVKHEWEGEVSCKHPTLTYVDEYGEPRKASCSSSR